MKQYRYLDLLTSLSVTSVLISDVTAPRMIAIAGMPVSVTVLYFPWAYLLGDILTEVYGYAAARRVAWQCLVASIIAGCLYQGVLAIPTIDTVGRQEAFGEVLGAVPRTLIGGWLALWSGMVINHSIMDRMKSWTEGRHLWLRAVTSTLIGELVNTTLFYLIALSGILGVAQLSRAILIATALKVAIEVLLLPLTYGVVAYLSEQEEAEQSPRLRAVGP